MPGEFLENMGILMLSVFLILLVLFVVFRPTRRQREEKTILKQLFDSEAPYSSTHFVNSTIYDDGVYMYEYFRPVRYQYKGSDPSYFKIETGCQASGDFKIIRERFYHKLFKLLGISREVRIQDHNFNEKFYILSDSVEFTSAFFQSSERRQAVEKIFRLGWKEISLYKNIMSVKWSYFQLTKDIESSLITPTISNLSILIKDIPVLSKSIKPLDNPRWKKTVERKSVAMIFVWLIIIIVVILIAISRIDSITFHNLLGKYRMLKHNKAHTYVDNSQFPEVSESGC